jgi:hypothetical protein
MPRRSAASKKASNASQAAAAARKHRAKEPAHGIDQILVPDVEQIIDQEFDVADIEQIIHPEFDQGVDDHEVVDLLGHDSADSDEPLEMQLTSDSESFSDDSSEYWSSDSSGASEGTPAPNQVAPEVSKTRKRGRYTGQSERTQRRKAALVKSIQASTPSIKTWFGVAAPKEPSPSSADSETSHEENAAEQEPAVFRVGETRKISDGDVALLKKMVKERSDLPNMGDHVLLLRAVLHYWTNLLADSRLSRAKASKQAALHLLSNGNFKYQHVRRD